MMKKLAVIIIIAAIIISGITVYRLGYYGERDFSSLPDELPPITDVMKNARALKHVPYDYAMGKFSDIGSKLGFIVCSDVPNIAYGLSGYSLKSMLEKDFRRNPSAYESSNGNMPGNPFFHRRARNLHAYFKNNNMLASASAMPKPGDMAFYHWTPNGNISHVALVTKVNGSNYMVMESAPETHLARETTGDAVIRRGWILAGFGRMYKK
jgi:hypothetical protein